LNQKILKNKFEINALNENLIKLKKDIDKLETENKELIQDNQNLKKQIENSQNNCAGLNENDVLMISIYFEIYFSISD
jgi:hypothetical protein